MAPLAERGGGDKRPGRGLDREIWAMAWPSMLSLMFANLADIVDIAVVARLGRNAVAAVGYAGQITHLVLMVLQAVGIGCVALMARAIGARQPDDAKRALTGSLVVGLAIAAFATLLVMTVPRVFLRALDAEPDVAELAVPYFRLVVGATWFASAWMMLDAAQRARRNTRVTLIVAIVMAVLKVVLDLVLIFGLFGAPRLELVGAGIATVVAQGAAVALYTWFGRVGEREGDVLLPRRASAAQAFASAGSVLGVAVPAMGERVVLEFALLAYFKVLSHYGPGAIAAYAIGVRLLAFSWLPGVGFGTAASTLVGQALGAREPAEARRAGWRSVVLALIVMAALGVIVALSREPMARTFTHDEVVVAELLPFLLMLAIAQPFMGAHFTLSGALRGAGDTVTPLIGAAIGNWVLRVPLAWFASRTLGLPVTYVWAALVTDHVFRFVWTVVVFRRGRWQRVGASAAA